MMINVEDTEDLNHPNKHLDYASFNEILSLVNSYLMDNEIADDIRIEFAVPHEFFRMIDTGVRTDSGASEEKPAVKEFEITYDEHLSAYVLDKTELIIEGNNIEVHNG